MPSFLGVLSLCWYGIGELESWSSVTWVSFRSTERVCERIRFLVTWGVFRFFVFRVGDANSTWNGYECLGSKHVDMKKFRIVSRVPASLCTGVGGYCDLRDAPRGIR